MSVAFHKINLKSLTFITKPPSNGIFCDGCHWHSSQNQLDVIDTHQQTTPEGFFVTDVIGIPHKISLTSLTFITKPPSNDIFCDGCHWHSSQNQPDVIDIHHKTTLERISALTDAIGIPHKISVMSLTFITMLFFVTDAIGISTKSARRH